MAVPTTAWNETTPADSALISATDDIIRAAKTQIREMIAVDHEIASSGQDTDWGYHKKVTLVEQSSNPDSVADSVILFAKDVDGKSELHFKDESGNVMQITSVGQIIAGMTDEVRMFYGTLAEIPEGWALCDGASGRPNYLAKFIQGTATAATEPGVNSGGSDSIELTSSNMPAHTHTVEETGSGHYHNFSYWETSYAGYLHPGFDSTYAGNFQTGYDYTSRGAHTHTVSSEGSSVTIDNRPAYYELAFLVRE